MTQYGWTFDKHGNAVQVKAPVSSTGKPFKRQNKTLTGKIPDSVGFSASKPQAAKESKLRTFQKAA